MVICRSEIFMNGLGVHEIFMNRIFNRILMNRIVDAEQLLQLLLCAKPA